MVGLCVGQLEEQMTKYSELEVEAKEWEAQLSAATGGRPMSARPISRMHKAGRGGGPPKGGKGVRHNSTSLFYVIVSKLQEYLPCS